MDSKIREDHIIEYTYNIDGKTQKDRGIVRMDKEGFYLNLLGFRMAVPDNAVIIGVWPKDKNLILCLQ